MPIEAMNTATAGLAAPAAILRTTKTADKALAYVGDTVSYAIAVVNSGTLPADNVVITDPLPAGFVYLPASLTASVPVSGDPMSAITLLNPIAPGQTVSLSFRVTVSAVPNPDPARNVATVAFAYGDPAQTGTSVSGAAITAVFRHNYRQQISDLIESVALQEAALAAIQNAEGAKIQRMVATPGVTAAELLCLNKSVTETLESITILESVLKLKLNAVDCQIVRGPCN